MKHPSDELLLAYVRKQQQHLWSQGLQEHIALCLMCSARCAELRTIGDTLEVWTRSYNSNPTYSTVSQRVLRELYAPSLSRQLSRDTMHIKWRVSLVALVGILCVVLLTGLTTHFITSVASFKLPLPKATRVVQVPTNIPQQRPTVDPTAIVVVGTTTTGTPKKKPTITTACTTQLQVNERHLFICGSSFTPGVSMTIYYKMAGGKSILKHTMQVDENGTFTDIWQVNTCRDVPIAIYAESTTKPPELAQIIKSISFGNCHVSRK